MTINLREFLLKTIPYLMSIAGGLVLFILTKDDIHDPSLTDLINNIAASLLSIPLVFLLYDYTNYRVSRQLKKTLADNATDKINVLLLDLIIVIRRMLGLHSQLTFASLNKMGDISKTKIVRDMKITPTIISELRQCHSELDTLMYQSANSSVLSVNQIQTLSAIERDIVLLINEHKYRRNRRIAAKYISNLISRITEWIDSDAFAAMHFQQLVGTAHVNSVAPSTDGQNPLSAHTRAQHKNKSWIRRLFS